MYLEFFGLTRKPFSKNSFRAARRIVLRRCSFSLSLLRSEPKVFLPVAGHGPSHGHAHE